MEAISTITTKGQVVIPKRIRDYFKLKPLDKVRFMVRDEMMVAEPVPTTDQVFGMLAGRRKRPITKKEMKQTIQEAVLEKFARKGLL